MVALHWPEADLHRPEANLEADATTFHWLETDATAVHRPKADEAAAFSLNWPEVDMDAATVSHTLAYVDATFNMQTDAVFHFRMALYIKFLVNFLLFLANKHCNNG